MNLVTSDLEDLTEFIIDDAHLANPVVTEDLDLLDAPSLCEALSGPKSDKWHHTILAIQNVVGCQFVLQKKYGADGNVTRFKAHLIAQGFSQWEGIDYTEKFVPIVKSASLCHLHSPWLEGPPDGHQVCVPQWFH